MRDDHANTTVGSSDPGFTRELGLSSAIWSSVTSIIGSAWLFGVLFAAQAAGTAALLGWVIAGVGVIVLALVHAELGAMFPLSGGTARFPHVAFGSVAGTSFGFFSWLQAVTTTPIECFAVMQYGSFYWHGLYDPSTGNVTGMGFVMTVVLMAVFTAINFLAMRAFAKVNNVISMWKIAVPVLTIVVLLFSIHPDNFQVAGGFMPYGIKGLFAALPAAGIVFSFTGFEQAVQTQLISGPRGWLGIPSGNAIVIGPFAGLAGVLGLGWLALVLRVDAFVSPFGTGLVYVTGASRLSYGLARNRYYPRIFAKTDRRGVPWTSLILTFLLGLVFLLPFPSWHELVSLVTGASVLMYAGAPLAMGAFRRSLPDMARAYRTPAASVLGPAAFIFANLLIYWSGFQAVWKLGVCVLIGYLLIGISMWRDRERPPMDWRCARWLPVYLLGLGVISWQGQYGDGTGRIPFWWDIAIVAVFSLLIYYWAIHSGLRADEIRERRTPERTDSRTRMKRGFDHVPTGYSTND